MRVGIACGGTGGHLFPGVATGQVLQERGHEVTLWLSGRSIEGMTLGDWEGPVVSVPASGFPSGLSLRALSAGLSLFRAMRQCRWEMEKHRPDVILGMGSYASVGPVLAARRLGLPIVLHEANAVPGRAITFLARHADAVGVTFPGATEYLVHDWVEVTGFPLRRFGKAAFDEGLLAKDVFTVLVMGGSQGAHRINEVASEAMRVLHERNVTFQVVHLTGRADEDVIRSRYAKAGVKAVVLGFLVEMEKAYAVADLAVSRSGAASCTELSVFGLPALLVPLPSARRDHQSANARAMAAGGGMALISERELTAESLADRIESCCKEPARMESMREAVRAAAVLDGAEKLADLVEEIQKG